MVNREINLNKNNNLFLFGARATGKSTLLRREFSSEKTLWLDLLDESLERRFRRRPEALSEDIEKAKCSWVVIDEVQKLPRLLDRVHLEIEKRKNVRFVLTGSSARKLRRGSSNLLAGRAFTHFLYPLTATELGGAFRMEDALQYGSLPKLLEYPDVADRIEYLNNYALTYLREEIVAEQLVRKVHPFQDFLEISAQCSGQMINFSRLGSEVGVDDKTIHSYFQILEDTLVGFLLKPYHRSVRKRQREAPKFYYFDLGVKRAIERTLEVPLVPRTSAYGQAFEHRVILEFLWQIQYRKKNYSLSYLRTKDDAELDLVVERPGLPDLLVEIKSSEQIQSHHVSQLVAFLKSWNRPAQAQIWYAGSVREFWGDVQILPWQEALASAF